MLRWDVLIVAALALVALFVTTFSSRLVLTSPLPCSWVQSSLFSLENQGTSSLQTLNPLFPGGRMQGPFCAGRISFPPTSAHSMPARAQSPPVQFIAETLPDTCNLLRGDACESIARGDGDAPDWWIQSCIEVALEGCKDPGRQCHALDFGSNVGLLSARMMQAGAQVLSVEPQADLCCATMATARLNGWESQHQGLCGGVTHQESQHMGLLDLSGADLYRHGSVNGQPVGIGDISNFFQELNVILPTTVPLFFVGDLVRAGGSGHYEFIKVDTDSIDGEIVRVLLDMQRQGQVSFTSLSLEVWAGEFCNDNEKFSQLLADLQADGYMVYRARNDEVDDNTALTEAAVQVSTDPAVKIWKFAKRRKEEWLAMDKSWRTQYQMFVTKLSESSLRGGGSSPNLNDEA